MAPLAPLAAQPSAPAGRQAGGVVTTREQRGVIEALSLEHGTVESWHPGAEAVRPPQTP
jgi:hypothetical protein